MLAAAIHAVSKYTTRTAMTTVVARTPTRTWTVLEMHLLDFHMMTETPAPAATAPALAADHHTVLLVTPRNLSEAETTDTTLITTIAVEAVRMCQTAPEWTEAVVATRT